MALSILDGNQSATTLSTILSSGQHITAHTVVSLGTQAITDMRSAVSGSVVSIPSLPAISGTVTANGFDSASGLSKTIPVIRCDDGVANNSDAVPVAIATESGSINSSNPLPISGTVTANVFGLNQNGSSSVGIPVMNYDESIQGSDLGFVVPVQISNTFGTIDAVNPLPISGTVTANSSNGSLTTRFGSAVTANTAFATSAVTNANRKYLLIQNITTAANVITVGIGFTPTTTQGIQLFAGAGLTFEGSYIPTGAVNLLSSVTASCYTILEA
jgi:hypothetical protein